VVARLRRRHDAGEFLAGFAVGQPLPPLSVSLRGPTARDVAAEFGAVQEWARAWRAADGGQLRVEYRAVGGRTIGGNDLPARVWIDDYPQLWSLLGVGDLPRRFADLVAATREVAPAVVEWMLSRPHEVLGVEDSWPRLLDTVRWIDANAGPDLYLRQLDVPGVDTKFVEQHARVLSRMLDRHLDPERVDVEHPPSDLVGRYRLRRKPQYVRFRWLDPTRRTAGFSEVEVRLDELARLPVEAGSVFVVENDTTYLALPPVPDAIAIFGGGYSITRLYRLGWLADRRLVYWGDIDTHGFAILDLLRQRFPHTDSVLMDRATLLAHESRWDREPNPRNVVLDRLRPAESALYRDLVEDILGPSVRLEQERIRFSRIQRALSGDAVQGPSGP
jgi:hypothetical protein